MINNVYDNAQQVLIYSFLIRFISIDREKYMENKSLLTLNYFDCSFSSKGKNHFFAIALVKEKTTFL